MVDSGLLVPETPRALKRSEYDRLVALGAFEGEHIELLKGTLVNMSPNDPSHASPIERLTMKLAPSLDGRATVRVQLPLVAADESEPEPDIAVVPLGDYSTEHPNRAHLVIEVAVSSLRKDRELKGPLYAASNVAEYWIVNVPERIIEVFREPKSGRYETTSRHTLDDSLSPEAFSDLAICVRDVFAVSSGRAGLRAS